MVTTFLNVKGPYAVMSAQPIDGLKNRPLSLHVPAPCMFPPIRMWGHSWGATGLCEAICEAKSTACVGLPSFVRQRLRGGQSGTARPKKLRVVDQVSHQKRCLWLLCQLSIQVRQVGCTMATERSVVVHISCKQYSLIMLRLRPEGLYIVALLA